MNTEVTFGRKCPDYSYVKRIVDKVLEDNSIIEPPISPKEIAQNSGIKVFFGTFPGDTSEIMGFYHIEGNSIYVNTDDAVNRQTFTIAHELGHALLHKEIISSDPSRYKVLLRRPMGGEKDPLEQEANAFAARLLVPRKFLDRYYKIATIEELSRLFVVSEDVIRYRLKSEYKLGL